MADIHFDHRLALEVVRQGVDALRLNPGNIGTGNKVREVIKAAQERSVPIRIGVNAGSLEKKLLAKYGGPTPEAMVESALGHVAILEKQNYHHIKISLKASDVGRTIDAYRLLADRVEYPLHVGITEAGTLLPGTVKSAVGIGILLSEGIGDTIRVSLTASPEREIRTAYAILRALGIRAKGVEVISCPTCSRTEIDLIGLAEKVEKSLKINWNYRHFSFFNEFDSRFYPLTIRYFTHWMVQARNFASRKNNQWFAKIGRAHV